MMITLRLITRSFAVLAVVVAGVLSRGAFNVSSESAVEEDAAHVYAFVAPDMLLFSYNIGT